MKNKILLIVALFVMVFSLATPVIADVSNAQFRTTVTVSNNSTLAPNVSIPFILSTSEMINASMLNITATDAVMLYSGNSLNFMPGWSTNPWVVFMDSVTPTSQTNLYLYTSGATDGLYRYFPNDSGMSVSDNGTLVLVNNFTIEQKGWVDTTKVGENLAYKEDAFRTYISGSGNVTSSILFSSMGSGATDRDADYLATSTYIDLANPAQNSSNISSVELWFDVNATGVRVGTFYLVSGTTYKCRDSEVVGSVTAGSKQIFAVDLDYELGDFIGAYWATGTIDRTAGGGSGVRAVAGEYIDPGDQVAYGLNGNNAMSIYGISDPISVTATGIDPAEHTIKVTLEER